MSGYAGQTSWINQVTIISHGENVSAGLNSDTNQPIQDLADRTAYLKDHIENSLQVEDLATSGPNQYIPVSQGDGTVVMTDPAVLTTGISGSIITDHGNLDGLGDDDHLQYALLNGARAFTNPVSGVTPTTSAHFTTKEYVDWKNVEDFRTASGANEIPVSTASNTLIMKPFDDMLTESITGQSISHDDLNNLDADDHEQYILGDGTRAFTNPVSGITPATSVELTNKYYVDNEAGGVYKSSFGNPYTTSAVTSGGGVQTFDLTDFGRRGTHVIRVRVEPSDVCSSFDIEFFREDGFSTLFHSTSGVTTAATSAIAYEEKNFDTLDDDISNEIHMKIRNNDTASASLTFDVEVEGSTII